MKSLRIAAYLLIAIHFLRETRRKLLPESRGRPEALTLAPVRVGIPRADISLDPVPIVTCLNWDVGRMLVRELHDRGIPSTISVPDETDPLTPNELAMMPACVVSRELTAITEIAAGRYSDLYAYPPPDFASRVADAAMTTRHAFLSDRWAIHYGSAAPSQRGAGR